jgi:methyl-accepting chemotaxis protein
VDLAQAISKGDLSRTLAIGGKDEIGVLVAALNEMVENLRNQKARLVEGVGVLAATGQRVSTILGHLNSNTARTSASVSETVATVEQVKNSAIAASDKAKGVAVQSREAVTICESGREAGEDTIKKIGVIKEQMESIAETVIQLSEHSHTIENIMASVQDLADQSNLLAVNASIEAARAGAEGRGFAVVATEIKSLSDQSKEAVAQVRSILDDTRKRINAVVMATEQGAKAVATGVEQSNLVGESMLTLSKSVRTSANAGSVIDATIAQQSIGMDQVSAAMASIDYAMRGSLESTAQLEETVSQLTKLGAELKDMVNQYRV